MSEKRVARLNSLLKEVISDVIRLDFKNPKLSPLITVTAVDITNDLRHAKVYVSVIGTAEVKNQSLELLNQASGFIAAKASKQVVMRFFPELRFLIDETVEKQSRIDEILKKIEEERISRERENSGAKDM